MPADPALTRRRQDALTRLGVLARAGDPSLSAIARIAAFVSGADCAGVHILDADHQHRVAGSGAPLEPHPREDSFCRLVVDGEQRIVCADATRDDRFTYSSHVTGDEPIRFYAALPLRVSDGTVVGTLCTWDSHVRELDDDRLARLEDLAAQAAAHLELVTLAADLGHAASHDALTGLANRLVLCDRLAQAFARRLRHGGEVLVVVADIDRFKAINDTFGHEAGDDMLIEVARRLTDAMRAEDTVARLGGDEFAVIAEVTDCAAAEVVVRRISDAFSSPCGTTAGGPAATVTIGAALAAPDDDVRDALARADGAMYVVKRGVSA